VQTGNEPSAADEIWGRAIFGAESMHGGLWGYWKLQVGEHSGSSLGRGLEAMLQVLHLCATTTAHE
jgi:hypothetical protein